MEATLAGILLYDLLDSFTAFTLYTAFGKFSKQFRDALISQNGVFLFLFFLDVSFLGEFLFPPFMYLFPSFNKRTSRLLLLLKIISSWKLFLDTFFIFNLDRCTIHHCTMVAVWPLPWGSICR